MNAYPSTLGKVTLKGILQQHPFAVFLILVPVLTWPFLILDALGSRGILAFRLNIPLMILTGYMPTLAALITTALTGGKKGVRALLSKLLIARVGLQWYAFAVLGFGTLCVVAILIYNQFFSESSQPLLSQAVPPAAGPVQVGLFIVVSFLITGLINGEELAWRGFALPYLQTRWNALTASLILGVIWSLFHLPLFFTLGGSAQENMSVVGFTLSTISLTILYTWMYNHTRGSVLLAYLLHASTNTWTVVLSAGSSHVGVTWIITALVTLAAVIVVVVNGAENLSRTQPRIRI